MLLYASTDMEESKWASTLVGTVSSPASKTVAAEENQDTESAGQDKDSKQLQRQGDRLEPDRHHDRRIGRDQRV